MADVTRGLDGELVLAPGEQGLAARVTFEDETFVIETDDGERNEWHRELVRGVPYDTRTMQLHLDAATLYFHASDPLVFAERMSGFLSAPRPERRRPRDERRESAVDLRGATPLVTRRAGRRRRRREHSHEWTSHVVGGGIVRRRCIECGDLSIDVTDTYEMHGNPNVVKNRRL